MSSMHWRAVRAFLLGPLVGTLVGLFLFMFLVVTKGTREGWMLYAFVGLALLIYGASWILGVPLYLLLVLSKRVRPVYFLCAFAAGGVLFGLGMWQRPALILLSTLTASLPARRSPGCSPHGPKRDRTAYLTNARADAAARRLTSSALGHNEALGSGSRITFQMYTPSISHAKPMRVIELLGTSVAPAVHKEIAVRLTRRLPETGETEHLVVAEKRSRDKPSPISRNAADELGGPHARTAPLSGVPGELILELPAHHADGRRSSSLSPAWSAHIRGAHAAPLVVRAHRSQRRAASQR